MALAPKTRPLWEDRFSRPSAEALLAEIPKPASQLVTTFQDSMLALEGVTEELAWQGIPWRWSFVFSHEGRPLAYLVPSPTKPLVCIPVSAAALAAIPPRKLSKSAREVITQSPSVAGSHWANWELSSKAQSDEILTLVQFLRDAAAAAAV